MPDDGPISEEEWQDWMDWSNTVDNALPHRHGEKGPRTSSKGTHQLPSPQASVISASSPKSSRKRKVSDEDEVSNTSAAEKKQANEEKSAQHKSHSIVEKRYRTNLNSRIAELAECIPNLKKGDSNEGGGQSTTILKHNKATVLTEAIAYIKQLERENGLLEQTNSALQDHSKQVVAEPAITQPLNNMHETISVNEKPASTPSPCSAVDMTINRGESSKVTAESASQPAQGMLRVPEEWRRMWRGELTSSPSRISSTTTEDEAKSTVKVRGGKYLGRLMVGSLAGIMVMDVLAATQEDHQDDRGLFAIPILRHAPRPWNQAPGRFTPAHIGPWGSILRGNLLLPFLECFLMFGFIGLLLFIYLFNSRPPSRGKISPTPTPQPAPSVASPLEVRQRAFLTAIQTIWFPGHHVLPELLALNVETAAYVVRQLLGWQTYSWLTGRSEQEEIARVRAWDIAIDAQLSGGDPEISKSRLVLSLWASGTLPSSPARFMSKALHIRILFWQPSTWPWLSHVLHDIAGKLANWQWNKARTLQEKLDKTDSTKTAADYESLTDHLKALLALSAEDLMTDKRIHKAHNLSWNASASGHSCSESMYEDTAMRGPLDALASWFSHDTLTSELTILTKLDTPKSDDGPLYRICLAESCAPPGSLSKIRALAAKAVLESAHGASHVARLAKYLKPTLLPGKESMLTSLFSVLDSAFEDLAEPDSINVKVCAHVAMMLNHAQTKENRLGIFARLSNILDPSEASLDTLGWAALQRLFLSIDTLVPQNQVRPMAEALIRKLDQTKGLDAVAKTAIRTNFQSVLQGALSQMDKRRISASSNDTGYASMSSDEDN